MNKKTERNLSIWIYIAITAVALFYLLIQGIFTFMAAVIALGGVVQCYEMLMKESNKK